MYYLEKQVESKIIIDRSEFIGILTPISDTKEIPEILKSIRKKYPKANHYVTAYVLDNTQGSNDDGEPSGTAGVPVLEILNVHQLKNVLAVVVRYFGGIKLGAGGLIRAYAKSASDVISHASLLEKILMHNYEITFTYDLISKIDHIFNDYVTDKSYLSDVTYTLSFKSNMELLDEHAYLFKSIKNQGTKEVLVPWKK
ncbi:IMPACT family protein [Acholeplasma granularum]|uniref:IMPACT family protein n=1 Tax=Acholeplasma granularum TaxID=264635 RepID=UPI0004B782C8|nr:YigZ family protein [Acholeplasma granularum]